jgi:hypothetical protein
MMLTWNTARLLGRESKGKLLSRSSRDIFDRKYLAKHFEQETGTFRKFRYAVNGTCHIVLSSGSCKRAAGAG